MKSGTSGPIDVRSEIMVDASGHRASLSKQAKLHAGFTRVGVGSEYDLSAPRCNQEEPLLIVGSRYAPAGYAWVFPWGEDRVRVGILHADNRANPKDYLADVMENIHRFGVDLTESVVRGYHFGLIPSTRLASQFAGDRIMAAATQRDRQLWSPERESGLACRLASWPDKPRFGRYREGGGTEVH